jgi:hypothetical protein
MPLQRFTPLTTTVPFKPLNGGKRGVNPQVETQTFTGPFMLTLEVKHIFPIIGKLIQISPFEAVAEIQVLINACVVFSSNAMLPFSEAAKSSRSASGLESNACAETPPPSQSHFDMKFSIFLILRVCWNGLSLS